MTKPPRLINARFYRVTLPDGSQVTARWCSADRTFWAKNPDGHTLRRLRGVVKWEVAQSTQQR